MMKNFKILLLLWALSFVLLINITCKKKKEVECDGCNNPVISTIKMGEEYFGRLEKRTDFNKDPNAPISLLDYKYSIEHCNRPVCNTFLICNNEILDNFGDIPSGGILVRFSGQLKELCYTPFGPSSHSYNHIVLTGISKIKSE